MAKMITMVVVVLALGLALIFALALVVIAPGLAGGVFAIGTIVGGCALLSRALGFGGKDDDD